MFISLLENITKPFSLLKILVEDEIHDLLSKPRIRSVLQRVASHSTRGGGLTVEVETRVSANAVRNLIDSVRRKNTRGGFCENGGILRKRNDRNFECKSL